MAMLAPVVLALAGAAAAAPEPAPSIMDAGALPPPPLIEAAVQAAAALAPLTRIIGGHRVSIERYPWQVSVQLWGRHHCGGSIISAAFVLTAAHCIDMAESYQVVAGTPFVTGGYTYDVIYKKVHEKHNSPPYSNDVALLKIRGEFDLGNKMEIVQLAFNRPAPGTAVTVTGWGATTEFGESSDVLLSCNIRVISLSRCQQCYPDVRLTDAMLCAGRMHGGKDACLGDSGGPLVDAEDRLVGVVSFGRGCGRPQQPGIYADVVTLRPWITANAGIL